MALETRIVAVTVWNHRTNPVLCQYIRGLSSHFGFSSITPSPLSSQFFEAKAEAPQQSKTQKHRRQAKRPASPPLPFRVSLCSLSLSSRWDLLFLICLSYWIRTVSPFPRWIVAWRGGVGVGGEERCFLSEEESGE